MKLSKFLRSLCYPQCIIKILVYWCRYTIKLFLIKIWSIRELFVPRFVLWTVNRSISSFKSTYNMPRACLLNRSPVPATVLKSNRSGLWRHIIGTCRRLRWLYRKHSNIVARHDKTPVKWTLLSLDKNTVSRDTSFMSRRSNIMLWFLYIKKLQYMHFQSDYFSVLRHTT